MRYVFGDNLGCVSCFDIFSPSLWFLTLVVLSYCRPNKGYGKYYKSLKSFLASQQSLKGKIHVEPLEDPGTTGNFEVTVDGQLIHSKRHGGQGRAESDKEKAAILRQIQEILEEMD